MKMTNSGASQSTHIHGFEIVIGIETHVQLATSSKNFSGASAASGAAVNTNIAALDIALPGALPVANRQAVDYAIRFGVAVDGEIAPKSTYSRKHYFYPDLPKGYQISQYDQPIVKGGKVQYEVDGIQSIAVLTRAHLEEDAGKSDHSGNAGSSGIDFNRAGVALLEVVTEPMLHSSEQAVAYAKALHALTMWIGICRGNLQSGEFRCDANVSVRRPGQALGIRREIKNLNSFRSLREAINFEVIWQIDQISSGQKIVQSSVLFDPVTKRTESMRSKEDPFAYRYFPDPDLPPIVIGTDWINRVRASMCELPTAMCDRLIRLDGLTPTQARFVTQSRARSIFYERCQDVCKAPILVVNWLSGEVARRLRAEKRDFDQIPITSGQLGTLLTYVSDCRISDGTAKVILGQLWTNTKLDLHAFLRSNLETRDGQTELLDQAIRDILSKNRHAVDDLLGGKTKALNSLVGQVLASFRNRADAKSVADRLLALVEESRVCLTLPSSINITNENLSPALQGPQANAWHFQDAQQSNE